MTNTESLLTLRTAFVATVLEKRMATASCPDNGSGETIQRALREQIEQQAKDVPAAWLRARLGLTASEEDVLWLLVAAETSSLVRGLIATVTGNTQLSVSNITEIVYGDVPSLRAHRELSNGRLHRLELVQRTDGGDETTPDFQRTLRAHP